MSRCIYPFFVIRLIEFVTLWFISQFRRRALLRLLDLVVARLTASTNSAPSHDSPISPGIHNLIIEVKLFISNNGALNAESRTASSTSPNASNEGPSIFGHILKNHAASLLLEKLGPSCSSSIILVTFHALKVGS
jgi:hypothetical protein